MIDEEKPYVPTDNIRSLLQAVSDGIDSRLNLYRQGTRYEGVRPSDTRVFVLALREPRSIAELARILGVSRQAVHASVDRLRQLKVVETVTQAGNMRDKLVKITDRGQNARRAAQQQIIAFEKEIAEVIGDDGLARLRSTLEKLEGAFAANGSTSLK